MSHKHALTARAVYGAYLTFQLVSHAHMYEDNDVTESRTYNHPGQRHLKNMIPFRHRQDVGNGNGNGAAANGGDDVEGSPHAEEAEEEEEVPQTSLVQALVLLAVVTVLVAITAEFLVDSVDGLTNGGGISKEFVSIILLAIVGNAAEHVTAVTGGLALYAST
jgi:Ca2+:H+ antiporter